MVLAGDNVGAARAGGGGWFTCVFWSQFQVGLQSMTEVEVFARLWRSNATCRGKALGIILALFFSANAVLIITYGISGVTGSSIVTGAFLVFSEVSIALLSLRQIRLVLTDFLFVALLVIIATSLAINGFAEPKEMILLAISLTAYPACRMLTPDLLRSASISFTIASAGLAIIGAVLTAAALFQQWPVPLGRPLVFGYFEAATHFLGASAFCLISLATLLAKPGRRALILFFFLSLPLVVFAASMVRFTFIALVMGLLVAFVYSHERRLRVHVAAIIIATLLSICAGLAMRYDAAIVMFNYAIEQNERSNDKSSKSNNAKDGHPVPNTKEYLSVPSTKEYLPVPSSSSVPILNHDLSVPSCSLKVNMRNSVAIRKALWGDALYLIPQASWFGFGLDRFMKLSCMESEIHTSVLQAVVEFGWIGGLLLVALIFSAGFSLLLIAKCGRTTRFVACAFTFVCIMSVAHGRISRDMLLFAMLGVSAGISESFRPKDSEQITRRTL